MKSPAGLVKNAEVYCRKMFRSDISSWNLRDGHMMETLVELIDHLQRTRGRAKVVVWAHNSHWVTLGQPIGPCGVN